MTISNDGLLFIDQTKKTKDKYDYDRLGKKGKRVGQAVFDILSKYQPSQTAGETLDAYAPDYAREIEKCIEDNRHKYKNPFYIIVFTKKEYWADNVVRNWFVSRQTPPYAFDMMEQYPNHTKTLYLIDAERGKIKLCWSLPGFDDCLTVAKNPQIYSQELVGWIEDCFTKKLDRDQYFFD